MGFSCPMNILGFGYDASFMVSFYEFIGFSYTFHEHFMRILSSSGCPMNIMDNYIWKLPPDAFEHDTF